MALIVILSNLLITMAFAYEIRNTSKAETLYGLNLFRGTDKGFELEKVFTRAQGTAVIVRLLGLEKAALASQDKSLFDDVKARHWAASYITFAHQHSIVRGTSLNIFSPERDINSKEFITLVLRGLGYTEATPETALALSVKCGLLKANEANELTSKTVFLRDDMIIVAYNALITQKKGDTKTLLQNHVENKVIDKEAAVASGLYYQVQTPLEVPEKEAQDPLAMIEEAIKNALKK